MPQYQRISGIVMSRMVSQLLLPIVVVVGEFASIGAVPTSSAGCENCSATSASNARVCAVEMPPITQSSIERKLLAALTRGSAGSGCSPRIGGMGSDSVASSA